MSTSPGQDDVRLQALDGLRARGCETKKVMVGLDGFIDEIIHVVDRRYDFETYSRLSTMSDYAKRIAHAAGKSTNIEWIVKNVKLGGNGPIMAAALGELGSHVLYVGAVGWPRVDPVFESLERYGEVVSVAAPGHTDAVEFDDGKIMHGKIETMKDVRWTRLVECMGGEPDVRQRLIDLDLIALTNWTMVPFSNEIYENLFFHADSEAVANPPMFFFDFADPEKRTREDLAGICELLSRSATGGLHIALGLNHKEALQVASVLGLTFVPEESPEAITTLAANIQRKTGITEVVIHPRQRAAVAARDGAWCVEGPFTPHPRLSTGAGDHFNAGYCHARLNGLSPECALAIGKATSGFYVRHGHSPSAADIETFLTEWAENRLPDTTSGPIQR
jgi:sugar/nucleoside kinase (ribokinase family)